MNWFIKLSQLQPFLKSLGLSDDLINLIQKINIKEVRNRVIELIQTNQISHNQINEYIQLLKNNYNTLITLTDNPHYKKWLINKYLDYDRLEEDKEKFKETLLRLRRSSIDKNINNYQDIPDIAYKLDNTKNQINKRNKGGELLNLPDGAELLGTTKNGLTVVKITTVPAANILADGTEWCVVNEEPAKDYLSKGPLYLLYKNNQRYALCHYGNFEEMPLENVQIMDIYDRPLKNKWEIILDLEPVNSIGIYHNPELAYEYIRYFKNNISKNEMYKLKQLITTDFASSYYYARDVLKGPFPEGEDAIATNGWYSYLYAKDVLKKPFIKGEDAIATSDWYSYQYALDVLKGPFVKGEDVIATNVWCSYEYALDVLEGPFPKGEDIIATNAEFSYLYARDVLKNRFLKGEKVIKQSLTYYDMYKKLFNIKE